MALKVSLEAISIVEPASMHPGESSLQAIAVAAFEQFRSTARRESKLTEPQVWTVNVAVRGATKRRKTTL